MVHFTSRFENTSSEKIRTFEHTCSILALRAPGCNNASKSRIACCLFAEFHICFTNWMFRFWVCYCGHSLCLMDSKRFSAMTTRIGCTNVSLITLSMYASLATWSSCSVVHIDINSDETIIWSAIFFHILTCESSRSSYRRHLKKSTLLGKSLNEKK